ncbi:MAG: DUF2124 family protein [Archaeoglobaceae archaeon]
MDKMRGIIGLTQAFRDAVSDLKDGSKVVFIGSPYVCTPFAELLAYAVRDRNFEIIFIPKAKDGEARKLEDSGVCYFVTDEKADPTNPDAIVLLGGLAMPKFGCSVEEVHRMIENISKEKKPVILGVCFMGIFKKQGWDKVFSFRKLIDATIEVEIR